jgi:hypothetical protein
MRRFNLIRSESMEGFFRSVHGWSGAVQGVGEVGDGFSVRCRDGEEHNHRRDDRGWHVVLFAGGARSSIDLAGFRTRATASEAAKPLSSRATTLRRSHPLRVELGEAHYRRSEESWQAAGRPRATLTMEVSDGHLELVASIRAGDPVFAPVDAVNPLDNEHADTMRAGVQLYLRHGAESGGWMLVPESGEEKVRVRPIADWGTAFKPTARWQPDDTGYEMRIRVPLPGARFDLDVLINETTVDRERRRGQLVLSGAMGEFVYLRGDRQDRSRLLPMVIDP